MKPSEKLKRLADLIGEAGRNYYERVKLVVELLQDRDWLAASFDGNDHKAAQTLEDEYLHDVCGLLSIFDLLLIYRNFPDAKQWQAKKWNLRKLLDECKPAAEKREVIRVKKSEHEAVVAEKKELEFLFKKSEKYGKDLQRQLDEAKERISTLEEENANLRGRVEELEKLLDRKFSKAMA